MEAVVIGSGPDVERRVQLLAAQGFVASTRVPQPTDQGSVLPDHGIAAIRLVRVDPPRQPALAREMVKRGFHVFIDRATALPARDAEDLAMLAEEAGVQICMAQPLRAFPLQGNPSGESPIRLVGITGRLESHSRMGRLFDSIDLALHLCGTGDAGHVEAEAVREVSRLPRALGVSLRMRNGAFVNISLTGSSPEALRVVAVSSEGETTLTADFDGSCTVAAYAAETAGPARRYSRGELIERETLAWYRALQNGDHVPYPVGAHLNTARLMGDVLARMK